MALSEEVLLQRHQSVRDLLADTGLSVREREIAAFLVLGESRDDVALRLGVSPYTLQSHVRSLYHKFAIHSNGALSGIIIGRLVDRLASTSTLQRSSNSTDNAAVSPLG